MPRPSIFADPIVLSVIYTVLVSVFFLAFPGVDLATTNLFYRGEAGFPYSQLAALNRLRTFARWLPWLIVAIAVLSLVGRIIGQKSLRLLSPRSAAFLLVPYALGVGLLVNVILKDHWGRPRPIQVDLYGGTAPYVPVWQISDYCQTNCSFVSGEASTAIWFVSLALVVPLAWRNATFAILLVFAVALSLNRIAFGAHFLSDIAIAWGLMAIVIAISYRLLLRGSP